jgi:DNA invertase Pin-like site-specific DNA recombinase
VHFFGRNRRLSSRQHERRARQGKGNPERPPLDQEKLDAAVMPMKSGMSPTQAARQTGRERSTIYREIQTNAKA